MMYFKKTILPILITGIWINISETLRWMFYIEAYWIEKYNNLNIILPNEFSNMITWMIWGFLYAILIFILLKKFNVLQTTFLIWFMIFVMMWIVVWNVGILPTGMLWFNAPTALLEVYIGAVICKKLTN